MRKAIVYIACSVDGYIAKPDGDISFLEIAANEGEDYGYAQFCATVDTIILGNKTFEKVNQMGYDYAAQHSDKQIYVWTSKNISGKKPNVTYVVSNLNGILQNMKNTSGKDIYIDGGAETVHYLLKEKLIDSMIITWIPILLGEGIKLFKPPLSSINLRLISSQLYETGVVQTRYNLEYTV